MAAFHLLLSSFLTHLFAQGPAHMKPAKRALAAACSKRRWLFWLPAAAVLTVYVFSTCRYAAELGGCKEIGGPPAHVERISKPGLARPDCEQLCDIVRSCIAYAISPAGTCDLYGPGITAEALVADDGWTALTGSSGEYGLEGDGNAGWVCAVKRC